jgi:hypothetical protein
MSETIFRYAVIALGVGLMFYFESIFKRRGDASLKAWFKGFSLAIFCVFVVALFAFGFLF